ncbi:MAG: type 2 isopentenyl-diphosphate Delta-isomerase, partial [Candidatus Bathyarchaeia archaeon]
KNVEETKKLLAILIEELKNSMFLVGASSIQALRKVSLIITGKTAEWLKMRGFNPESYARRQ